MALETTYASSKEPSVFLNKEDFDIGATHAVINKCSTSIALNTKTLFVGLLEKVTDVRIITVGGEDHLPSHKGRLAYRGSMIKTRLENV